MITGDGKEVPQDRSQDQAIYSISEHPLCDADQQHPLNDISVLAFLEQGCYEKCPCFQLPLLERVKFQLKQGLQALIAFLKLYSDSFKYFFSEKSKHTLKIYFTVANL